MLSQCGDFALLGVMWCYCRRCHHSTEVITAVQSTPTTLPVQSVQGGLYRYS